MDKEAACAARVWKKLAEAPESIHWIDLCQPPFRKHSQLERDVALQAGTLGNRPGEAAMIDFWRRPWLFWRILWLGLLLSGSCALLVYGCQGLLHLTHLHHDTPQEADTTDAPTVSEAAFLARFREALPQAAQRLQTESTASPA